MKTGTVPDSIDAIGPTGKSGGKDQGDMEESSTAGSTAGSTVGTSSVDSIACDLDVIIDTTGSPSCALLFCMQRCVRATERERKREFELNACLRSDVDYATVIAWEATHLSCV